MAGKSLKRIPTAPMQTCAAVPITDPTEIAELEAKIKCYQDADGALRARSSAEVSKRTTADEVLELAGQLSAHSQIELITELAAQLSTGEQSKLVKQLVAQLPADARQSLR